MGVLLYEVGVARVNKSHGISGKERSFELSSRFV